MIIWLVLSSDPFLGIVIEAFDNQVQADKNAAKRKGVVEPVTVQSSS